MIDPLTYKPTEVNAILGAFGGTEKLERGKKEANLRKTQKDAEARTIAEQIRTAEERRAKLTDMQLTGDQIGGYLLALERESRALELESHWLDETVRYRQEIVRYRQIVDALVPPDITGLEHDYRLSVSAEQAAEAHAFAKWLSKPMAKLSDVATFWDDSKRIQTEIAALETALKTRTYVDRLGEIATWLQTAPSLWTDVKRLWNEIACIEIAVEAGKHVVSTDKLKTALTDSEVVFNDGVRLWNSIKRLEGLSALLGELKGSADGLAGVEAELLAAQAELQKGMCPKCGKTLGHECR